MRTMLRVLIILDKDNEKTGDVLQCLQCTVIERDDWDGADV